MHLEVKVLGWRTLIILFSITKLNFKMIVQIYIQSRHCITAFFHKPSPTLCVTGLICFATKMKIKYYLHLIFHFIDYYYIEQVFLCVLLICAFWLMNHQCLSLYYFLYSSLLLIFIHSCIQQIHWAEYWAPTIPRNSLKSWSNINEQKKNACPSGVYISKGVQIKNVKNK